MRSSFSGLNTLLRALEAQQAALDTTNHNIANANTDGYSRQKVTMTTTSPYTQPAVNKPSSSALQMGTGVMVSEIRRQRDLFLDLELRNQSQQQSEWSTVASGLGEIEAIFNEPGDQGLRTQISDFFNSWADLANNPQSGAARAAVRSTADVLAQSLNEASRRLTSAREIASATINNRIPEINNIGTQIATLNAQIANIMSAGDVPNDLLDDRDRLLDQLTQMTGAAYREESDGQITVSIGGRALVTGDRVNKLISEASTLASGLMIHEAKWALDGQAVTFNGGEVAGLISLRDELIPQQQRQLDLLASTIAGTVNEVHRTGFGVGQFATSTSPSNFFDSMTGAMLGDTGLATDLRAGTITIGATTITISPMSQSITDVMNQVVAAINLSPGVTAPATWALDPKTGKVSIDYQTASATTTVALGSSNDTSNFLKLLGIVGAADTVVSTDPFTLNSNRQIGGLLPVSLVSAGHISVDQAIRNSLDAIAAAGGVLDSAGNRVSAGPGDNTNALALAAMQRSAFSALGGLSFESYYDTNTTDLGSITRQAETNTSTQDLLLEHLQARRESFSGVSLDEEATQLIKYQRAYQAAARGISALDEMLDTIISRMGRVGN